MVRGACYLVFKKTITIGCDVFFNRRAWFESTFSRILDEIYLLSRAIQIIIEVSTAAAISITMPSKSSSFLPANSIASALNTSAAPMLPSTASPVAAYTCLFNSVRFVCARYARIIPTMRNASRPSRNVIMKLGIILFTFFCWVFLGVPNNMGVDINVLVNLIIVV